MKNYCFHDEHGRIVQYGRCPEADLNLQTFSIYEKTELPDEFIAPVNDEYYIDVDGQHLKCDDYDLAAIPLPCTANIEGLTYDITETPEFEFDAPGVYQVIITPQNGKYRVKEFSIENTA